MKTLILIIIFIMVIGAIVFNVDRNIEFKIIETKQEKITDIQEIATSFNDSQRVLVKTDQGFYFINSLVSVLVDEVVIIKIGVDGWNEPKTKLCIKNKCYGVIQ